MIMICLGNLSGEKLHEIASAFAEAFLSEDGIVYRCMDQKTAVIYFETVLEEYMRIHALYALSEREEGYIVWHHKKAGMPWYRDIVLMIRFIRRLPPLVTQKMILIRKDWQDYTLAHAKDRDYIDVSLIAVKKEYQGTGCLRKLLAEPFAEAERCGCACILDTDSSLKAAKYMHVGMQCEKDAVLESGVHMYTMRYPQM